MKVYGDFIMSETITKEIIEKRFKDKGLNVIDAHTYKTNKTKLTSVDSDGYLYYFCLKN